MNLLKDKRFVVVCGLIALLAFGFWAGSRVPDLNEKAAMGGNIQLEELGFERVFVVKADDPITLRIIYTTVNWMNTNKKGMAFGILFASSLMTLFSIINKKSYQSGFANTVLGMMIGAPLGVCVNCAAPIAKGMHSAGARVETMLAAMMSSPTLNVIVLTMLFSLFPFYLGVIKIGFTIGFILIGIPLLSRLLLRKNILLNVEAQSQALKTDPRLLQFTENNPQETGVQNWWKALLWLLTNFAKNLWFIVRTTVPLMILAGFLGALIITLLPWESLADVIPATNIIMILISMTLVALVGIVLPVPIAFDVLVPAILMAAGMPVKYVMVLLFTLGIFSIYPFFIVWQDVSRFMATSLIFGLAALGVIAGVIGNQYSKWDLRKQNRLFYETLSQASAWEDPKVFKVDRKQQAQPDGELVSHLQGNALIAKTVVINETDGLSVGRTEFQPQVAKPGKLFSRFEGDQFGLDEPYSFSILKFIPPFAQFRGIASGDIHNDGWIDILLTSEAGLSLYANQGGKYVLQQIDIPQLSGFYVVNAALVDLNNDGWLDIFFSSYRDGNYMIFNREGRFSNENLHPLPNHTEAVMSAAAAFGDLDRDGDLDIAIGNWSLGFITRGVSSPLSSQNVLLLNDLGGFQLQPLSETVGETLSTLLSDFNDDGYLDLIIGNDFRPPDIYYFGNGNGDFKRLSHDDGIIPYSPMTTMSIATADLNNDLIQEIYLGQITGFSGDDAIETYPVGTEVCDEITDSTHKEQCKFVMTVQQNITKTGSTPAASSRDAFKCLSIEAEEYRQDCIALHLLLSGAYSNRIQELCDLFPNNWEKFSFVCDHSYRKHIKPTEVEQRRAIPQIMRYNTLLMSNGNGRFIDKAGDMGVQITGWTWNAKFADVDNDQWQDLYAVNGHFLRDIRESNFFYHNQLGERFIDKTKEYGLDSFLATSSYSYIDLDNDGDLDIVSIPAVGPVWVYINNSTKGKSLAFELHDEVGNHFGIGSKIIIYYGPDERKHQMREIQAGGGFISFDAPIAYFGLGEFDKLSRVEIVWSTGERSEIQGDFAAGARYTITRTKR